MQIWSKIRRNIWHISRILDQICIKKFLKAESPVMKEVIKHALRAVCRYTVRRMHFNFNKY